MDLGSGILAGAPKRLTLSDISGVCNPVGVCSGGVGVPSCSVGVSGSGSVGVASCCRSPDVSVFSERLQPGTSQRSFGSKVFKPVRGVCQSGLAKVLASLLDDDLRFSFLYIQTPDQPPQRPSMLIIII